jgi:hypothetical protein
VHLELQVQLALLLSLLLFKQARVNLVAVAVEPNLQMLPEQLLMHVMALPDLVVADHLQLQLFR